MFCLPVLVFVLGFSEPAWHNDYDAARDQAKREKKDLLLYFHEDDRLDRELRKPEVRTALADFVCLKVPASYTYRSKRLLDYDAMEQMLGKPGLAVVSYRDDKLPAYGEVISAHPFVASRYHWAPDYSAAEIKTILELPATATLSQRSMIYAIRVHPERPRSVHGEGHQAFLSHASRHSARQASSRNQHHANLIQASDQIRTEGDLQFGGASEVVAQSWGAFVGGENVLEAAFSCVDAWRHSPGHWSAVSGTHRYFGYDIARASDGTWYATGIFAD